MHFSAWSAVY